MIPVTAQLLILPQQFQQKDCQVLHVPHLHRDHNPCIHQSADKVKTSSINDKSLGKINCLTPKFGR